jgi:hypothetical protein
MKYGGPRDLVAECRICENLFLAESMRPIVMTQHHWETLFICACCWDQLRDEFEEERPTAAEEE